MLLEFRVGNFRSIRDVQALSLVASSDKEHSDTHLEATGMATVAQKTDLSRETLYRTLSSRGNPTIRTLSAVLKATGLKFGVTAH